MEIEPKKEVLNAQNVHWEKTYHEHPEMFEEEPSEPAKKAAELFRFRNLCRMMRIHRSGYYAWLNQPKSARQKDDERLLGLIKQLWVESAASMAIARSTKTSASLAKRAA